MSVEMLNSRLAEKLSEIISKFDIQVKEKSSYYTGICPIHPSDNETSLTLFKDRPIWKCWTNQCEEELGSSLFGLIWGLLGGKDKISYQQVYQWIVQFVNFNEPIPQETIEKKKFIRLAQALSQTSSLQPIRFDYRSKLKIPSEYFIGRGYAPSILSRLEVGDYKDRAVCPIFNNQELIGFASRYFKRTKGKWVYSSGFNAGSWFYGLWLAMPEILRTRTVILTEGQGGVFKLHDFGYENTVGCFGARLTDNQVKLLNELGVMNISLVMDPDSAGQKAADIIMKRFERFFNIKRINLPDDIDVLSAREVERLAL